MDKEHDSDIIVILKVCLNLSQTFKSLECASRSYIWSRLTFEQLDMVVWDTLWSCGYTGLLWKSRKAIQCCREYANCSVACYKPSRCDYTVVDQASFIQVSHNEAWRIRSNGLTSRSRTTPERNSLFSSHWLMSFCSSLARLL